MSSRRITRPIYLLFLLQFVTLVSGCSQLGKLTATANAQEPVPPIRSPLFSAKLHRGLLPDRLSLPSIQLDIPVVELGWTPAKANDGQIFSEWDVANYAAGWHKNSAMLGETGNVVMSGHNNILGAVFRELDQLKRGDPAIVWAGAQRFDYRIEKVMIVPEKYATAEQRRENAKWIGSFEDQRLTLVSCWPRDDNTHRIIVVAHLLEKQ